MIIEDLALEYTAQCEFDAEDLEVTVDSENRFGHGVLLRDID